MVKERSNADPAKLDEAKRSLQHLARDHSRVPMQWDTSAHAGFSSVKPWMRANDDYDVCNARQQVGDKKSVLAYWRQMLDLRRQHKDLFVYGDFELVDEADENLFIFTKENNGSKALVVCNFTKQNQSFNLPANAKLLVGTHDATEKPELQAFEGRVYLL